MACFAGGSHWCGATCAQPVTYAISLVGATIYASAVVGTTVVLGWATNEVIVPAFSTGTSSDQVRAAALGLLAVGWLRALSIVLRRYFAALTTFRTQASLRRGVRVGTSRCRCGTTARSPRAELLLRGRRRARRHRAAQRSRSDRRRGAHRVATSASCADPVLTLIALLLFPALAVVNRIYTRRVEVPVGRAQAKVGQVSRVAHESFDGALVVKTLGRSQHEIDRLAVAADELRDARIRVGRIRATFEPTIDAIPNVGIIVLLLVGSWQVANGRLSPGDLVQGVALFSLLAFPVRVVGFFLQEMPRAVVSIRRIGGAGPAGVADPGARPTPARGVAPGVVRPRRLRLRADRPGAHRRHRRHRRR
jgi:ABC-type multidrug transport system fused ATPase/permease subunit